MQRNVGNTISLNVTEPAELLFAVAVASDYPLTTETLEATVDGVAVETIEYADAHGGRLHHVRAQPGTFELRYDAAISGLAPQPEGEAADRFAYLRPSRYAESDSLAPTAAAEFAGIEDAAELLASVSSWVGTRLTYVPGSSLPTDGAVRTILARQGVCRDYSHACIALLRALGIPARLAAVYAPGLDPMDFHAVAEAWVDGSWRVVDATTLAPRSTLVRIATGRDAADTAFLNVLSGRADLLGVEVTAVADVLPDDDVTALVSIR